MALSAFDEPDRPPEPADVTRCLGGSARHWEALRAHVAESYRPLTEEWGFPGTKFGWSLRLKRKDRVLLYLTPQEGRFLVGIVLGEKAVAEVPRAGVSPAVRALLDAAPKYAEGRGIRVEIGPEGDIEDLRRLVALKAAAPPRPPARKAAAKEGRSPGRARKGRG